MRETLVCWSPWIALMGFTACWVARWPSFPLLLDPYYHLFIARQIADAGGPLWHEWWELAPAGRPHLYPPVLHLWLAMWLRLGVPPLVALRLTSAVFPPVLLITLWAVVRRLLNPRTASTVLAASLLPFSFHLHSAITLAATLGMIESLWLLVALVEERWIAAGWLIALLCYTHLGLPVVMALTMGAALLLGATSWQTMLRAGWGLLLTIPWWVHLWGHRSAFRSVTRYENTMVELMPMLLTFAVAGLWRSWRVPKLRWLIALAIGFLPLVGRYAYRWLSGEGLLPIILLAGVGLVSTAETLARWWTARRGRSGAPGPHGSRRTLTLLLGVLLLAPSLTHAPTGWHWRWFDAAPWHLLNAPWTVSKPIDVSFASPQMEELARVVARQTQPGEIVWSNAPYALGLIAALADRPIASAMFNEVVGAEPANPPAVARLIVWFKFETLPGARSAPPRPPGPLTVVADQELAVVYRQAGVTVRAKAPAAGLPLVVALLLLLLGITGIVWDLGRARQAVPRPV